MAEYYPLLLRAVASMREAPVEKRRAIYDRARNALLEQLRSMQPAIPEDAIVRESAALDEAIERIEAEIGNARSEISAEAPPSLPEPGPPPEQPSLADVPTLGAAEPAATVVATAAPVREALAPGPVRPNSPVARPGAPALRPSTARPAAEALQRLIVQSEQPPPVIRADRGDNDAKGAAALPTAPKLQVATFADAVVEAGTRADETGRPGTEPGGVPERVAASEEPARPAAPRPVTRERFNPRVLILTAVGALVVLAIAYTAYRLRDRPEALARARAARVAAEQADVQRIGKVSNRAVADQGASGPVTSNAPGAAQQSMAAAPAAGAPAPASDPTPSTATSPAASESVGGTPSGSNTTPRPDQPSIPIAQRAAFLIDAPDDPQKVKTYVGTVVWRTDSINPGQGQTLVQAVRADIDIPDVGLKLTMLIQKNLEAQFPASHTLDLKFTPGNNTAANNVKQINVPQMRKDDSPTGDALVGLPVTITENYFLVGLSRGDASGRNLDLIKGRNWFDIPLLMSSGKVAKITFEKGATGQQIIDQVLESWQ